MSKARRAEKKFVNTPNFAVQSVQLPDSAAKGAPGYHITEIPKGECGEASKIREETAEFMDAVLQGSKVLALVELSDLIGAIDAYLERHHPDMTIGDLRIMATITERAFKNGHRS